MENKEKEELNEIEGNALNGVLYPSNHFYNNKSFLATLIDYRKINQKKKINQSKEKNIKYVKGG
jgi:hypothetical protein